MTRYHEQFAKTLILTNGIQENDVTGQGAYTSQGKIYITSLFPSFRSFSPISLELTVRYLDNQSGYLRCEYDNGTSIDDTTLCPLVGDNTWKTCTYTLTAILVKSISQADISLFSSISEGTTADLPTSLQYVLIYNTERHIEADWHPDGKFPYTHEIINVSLYPTAYYELTSHTTLTEEQCYGGIVVSNSYNIILPELASLSRDLSNVMVLALNSGITITSHSNDQIVFYNETVSTGEYIEANNPGEVYLFKSGTQEWTCAYGYQWAVEGGAGT